MAKCYDNFSREELIELLNKQDKELALKKYGLVWDSEKEPEKVVQDCQNNLPILQRVSEKEIKTDDSDYNILIEGDNFHALSVLNYTHKEKIDVIYIDPPYNTGTEEGKFIYNDKFVLKEDGYRHSKWLNFMEKRLNLAKNLLNDNGVIFISIDENEEANLTLLMNKIFGESNFVEKIIWNKRIPKNDKGIGNIHEYILMYVKNSNFRHEFYMPKDGLEDVYSFVADLKRKKLPIEKAEIELKKFYKKKGYDRGITLYCNLDENYRLWGKINMSWPNAKNGPRFDVIHPITKKTVKVPDNGWRWTQETFLKSLDYKNIRIRHDGSCVCGSIWFAKDENTQPSSIKYLDEVEDILFRSLISLKSSGGMELDEIVPDNNFSHPKTYKLIKLLINSIKKNDITILDFFAGSGTTAHAVLSLNKDDNGTRKYILCTNNENQKEEQKLKKSLKFNDDEYEIWKSTFPPKYVDFQEKYGICSVTTYPRLKAIINGYNKKGNGELIEGYKSNLQYFKTDFIKNSENIEQLKVNLTYKCTEMLCLKENIYNLKEEQEDYKIFESNKKDKYLCVYYNFINDSFEDFLSTLKKLEGQKIIYMFSMDDSVNKELFEDIDNFEIETIPQKILDIYKKIIKENVRG